MDKCPTLVHYLGGNLKDDDGRPAADEQPCGAEVYHDPARLGGAGAYVCKKNSTHVHPGPVEESRSSRADRFSNR